MKIEDNILLNNNKLSASTNNDCKFFRSFYKDFLYKIYLLYYTKHRFQYVNVSNFLKFEYSSCQRADSYKLFITNNNCNSIYSFTPINYFIHYVNHPETPLKSDSPDYSLFKQISQNNKLSGGLNEKYKSFLLKYNFY